LKPTSRAAGLPLSIPFAIPAHWTPEQALAVVELLDELRERIWAHYGVRLIDEVREQHLSQTPDQPDVNPPDAGF
jgi:hypothetical protein